MNDFNEWQPEKHLFPKDLTPLAIDTEVRSEQSKKASSLISFTLLGMIIDLILYLEKEALFI